MWCLAKPNLAKTDPTWACIDESYARWHLGNGIAAFPFITQAGGYFRRLEQGRLEELPENDRIRGMFDHGENRERFRRIRCLQQRYNLSVSQVVLAYLTNQPFPVFPLVGPKTLPDLKETLSAAGARLSQADLLYLEIGT
jgi:aryl-alcohol dehydrogenase-like predicted oxidoreductase